MRSRLKANRAPKKPLSLKRILSYSNPNVIDRFCRDLGLPRRTALLVFKDLMRFLYLAAKLERVQKDAATGRLRRRRLPPRIFVPDEILIIDEMWHAFVLHTMDYARFNERYFDVFLHHDPTPPKLKKKVEELTPRERRQYRDSLELYLTFVVEELGESVLKRWFITYPRTFGRQKIARLKHQAAQAA